MKVLCTSFIIYRSKIIEEPSQEKRSGQNGHQRIRKPKWVKYCGKNSMNQSIKRTKVNYNTTMRNLSTKISNNTDKENTLGNTKSHLYVSKEMQLERKSKYEEQQKENELKNFTGKPIINKKSQAIFYNADNLIEWENKMKEHTSKRIQEILEERNIKEKLASRSWKVSRGSLKYLADSGRLQSNEKVELSLLRRGKQ